jgi:heme exporter protein C
MKTKFFIFFIPLVLVLMAYGTYQGLVVAPTEQTMGDVQRIFYYHVPSAAVAFTCFFVNFIASIFYLWKRSKRADAWALASAEVGVVFCAIVLITGPIWARYAWGVWWTWDARLTTTLILWLLYVSYLALRRSSEAGSTSVLAASLGVFAFLDVPIVYMANRWFRTNHPQPVFAGGPNSGVDPRMGYAMLANIIAWMAYGALVLCFRYTVERSSQKVAEAYIQKASRGTVAVTALFTLLLFQKPSGTNPHVYLYGAYGVTWAIHIVYLLVVSGKIAKLKRERAELTAA